VTNYFFYIKRLFSLPPRSAAIKIMEIVKTAAFSRIEKIKTRTLGDGISDNDFSIALKDGRSETIKKFVSRSNIFLPDKSVYLKGIHKNSPEKAKKILGHADRICEHKFDLLGSGEVFLGAKIDWHSDFKIGYRWSSRKFYKDIEIPYGKGDIKVPWELSRFQHLILLGQAYQISRNEKYAAEFVDQITDWIKKNPVKIGPNWACTMDVAIRAANWLVGWEFVKPSCHMTSDFTALFLKSLLVHARFIRSHLENTTGLTSNHYLSDIAGLFFIAMMVPEFRESEEWLIFAKKELESEIRKQVYDDGCDFEASTCYHRLVLELFFYPALLAKRNRVEFSQEYNLFLKKMFETVPYLIKPDGRMPQIGDNDNGRFLKFESPDTEILDMRYLLPLAAIYFDDPQFKVLYSDKKENNYPDCLLPVLWVFGPQALKIWYYMPARSPYEFCSRAFPVAGWYVMRDKDNYMIISNGKNGQNGNGGHAHNDKLSFELSVNGADVIVDPGTYVYTSEPVSRNRFRSTGSHNTIMINDEEQNPFQANLLFILPDNTKAVCKQWHENESEVLFAGEHYGYQRLKNRCVHERSILYRENDREYIFEDRLSGTDRAGLKLSLHFAPDFFLQRLSQRDLRATNSFINIMVEFEDNTLSQTIEGYLYSHSYGKSENAKKAVFSGIVNLPYKFKWRIKVKS